MMKQSYMLEALIKNYILTDCGVHTDFLITFIYENKLDKYKNKKGR